ATSARPAIRHSGTALRRSCGAGKHHCCPGSRQRLKVVVTGINVRQVQLALEYGQLLGQSPPHKVNVYTVIFMHQPVPHPADRVPWQLWMSGTVVIRKSLCRLLDDLQRTVGSMASQSAVVRVVKERFLTFSDNVLTHADLDSDVLQP